MYIKLEFVLGRDSGAVKIPIYTKKRIYILEYCIKEYIRKCYESAQKMYVKKKICERKIVYIHSNVYAYKIVDTRNTY